MSALVPSLRPVFVFIVGLLLHAGAALAQHAAPDGAPGHAASTGPVSAEEAARWRTDLAFLAEQLATRHRDAFYRTPRETFEAEVRRLDARIPGLARHEIIAGLQRLTASLLDGHTTLLLGGPQTGFHYLPVDLYLFGDGLFVRAATPEHADLVGARIVRIGRATAEAAVDSAARYVSHENTFWVQQNAPVLLRMPEVLHAMGLTEHPDRVSYVVEQDGRTRTVELRPVGVYQPPPHGRPIVDMTGWTDLAGPATAEPPLRSRRPADLFWAEYVAADRMLYVAYRAVADRNGDEPNGAFFRRAFALADSLQPERFVLDLRDNHGGNSFFNREVLRQVIQRPWLDRPDRFFVLIGRGTFSAAQNLVNDLEYFTNATLVGEPTGNSPNLFGDHVMVQLPNSGLLAAISTRWHQGPRGDTDRRLFTPPRLFAVPTAADYAAHRDPALQAVLDFGTAPPLRDQLVHVLASGDTALAARRFEAYRTDPLNTYTSAEVEANAAGYALLGAGRMDEALFLFRLNTAAYPGSANAFDSLGEGYERAGRRAEAAASYRRALALDPTFGSSRAGLERVGG